MSRQTSTCSYSRWGFRCKNLDVDLFECAPTWHTWERIELFDLLTFWFCKWKLFKFGRYIKNLPVFARYKVLFHSICLFVFTSSRSGGEVRGKLYIIGAAYSCLRWKFWLQQNDFELFAALADWTVPKFYFTNLKMEYMSFQE